MRKQKKTRCTMLVRLRFSNQATYLEHDSLILRTCLDKCGDAPTNIACVEQGGRVIWAVAFKSSSHVRGHGERPMWGFKSGRPKSRHSRTNAIRVHESVSANKRYVFVIMAVALGIVRGTEDTDTLDLPPNCLWRWAIPVRSESARAAPAHEVTFNKKRRSCLSKKRQKRSGQMEEG